MYFTAKLIYPQIVHCRSSSQYFLASTFMRVQEFYESPFENIRGKAFTVFEYMDTEARANGKFDYFTKWGGFNLPDFALKNFLKKQKVLYFDKEALKFLYIRLLVNWKKPFYVIGTFKDKDINHELAHAFYYLSKEYRHQMDRLTEKMPQKTFRLLCEWFEENGYPKEVFWDELQAYLCTENELFPFVDSKIKEAYKNSFEIMKSVINEEKI